MAASSGFQKVTYNSIIAVSDSSGDSSGDSGLSNTHTISNPAGSNTVEGPFTATSNSGNNGATRHSLFDANGNSIGYPVPEMPGGPQYVLSADDYGGMAWALFASKIQAALSSSDGSVTFTPTGSGSDVTVNVTKSTLAVINSTATDYTFLASDANSCHLINTSASTTRTVPSDSTAPNILIGDSIEVQNIGTGVVTFVAASGVTIRSSLTLVMYGQYSVCMLRKIAANTWVLTGERTAV